MPENKHNKVENNKEEVIDYFLLGNPLSKARSRVSYQARKKMFHHFTTLTNPKHTDLILDVGVTPDCSLQESNYFEKLYPYPSNITMCSIEDASNLEKIFAGTKFVRLDGGAFPFDDKQFDILFCSAVLEHVGNNEAQGFFIRECLRVAKCIYLTTPNKHFPVEFHTILPLIHLLPQPIHQRLLRMLGMDFWAKTENLNLLSKRTLSELIPPGYEAQIHVNRLLGIVSNLILYVHH